MLYIDIIILSYAKNDHLKSLTQQTLDTLLASEAANEIKFNPIVIESEKSLKSYQFPGSTTLYPEEKFGYNRFMNIGTHAIQIDHTFASGVYTVTISDASSKKVVCQSSLSVQP